jgi:hypothetical protein
MITVCEGRCETGQDTGGQWSISHTGGPAPGKVAVCFHGTGDWVVIGTDLESVANNLTYINFIK